MPNWCKNYITFSGDKENLEKVHQTFIQMQNDEDETNEGQKPDFLEEIKDGYFFGFTSHSGTLQCFIYTGVRRNGK